MILFATSQNEEVTDMIVDVNPDSRRFCDEITVYSD